ncbi:unnamed protein product [Ambrosiozyma monospora]|uniref:Unnamed protein product n=1 Tax=Ambrosiozyma monospora TaxID=43982 RepID=A0ACB5T596_AMBMO|nr:unnamed protein product [Ambrosiozyma monospora]
MLNVFRIAADFSHLASILILIHSISTTKSTKGISLKTQVLYAIVFITRYLDLITLNFSSVYNTLMKLFFIGSSGYTIHLMKKHTKSIEGNPDIFQIKWLVGGSVILGLLFNYKLSILEVAWSFSLWLESVAILPQLFLLQKEGQGELLTIHYIFALGLYRALYIPNWFYRYFAEGRLDLLSIITGIIQTLLYSDFFYIYYKKVVQTGSFALPQ